MSNPFECKQIQHVGSLITINNIQLRQLGNRKDYVHEIEILHDSKVKEKQRLETNEPNWCAQRLNVTTGIKN